MRKRFPVIAVISSYLSFGLAAEELDDLFNYDLEDLLEVEITVATKSDLAIRLSPSSVNAYNRKQLNQMNIQTLADLADVTPGYSSYSIYGERVFETRGQKAGSFENNKHLVLLDGIPLNHTRSNKAPTEYELPLATMSQVEMLTGPASSLYGVGAFFGVANLTSNYTDSDQLNAYISYEAEVDAEQLTLNGNFHSYLGHSYLAFSSFNKEASNEEVAPHFSELQQYYDDQKSEFGYFNHKVTSGWLKDTRFGFIKLNRKSGLGEHWMGDFSVAANSIEWDTKIKFIQVPIQLSESVSFNTQYLQNTSTEIGFAANSTRGEYQQSHALRIPFIDYRVNVKSDQLQSELSWSTTDEQQLLLGFNYEEKVDQGGYFNEGLDITKPEDWLYSNPRLKSDKVKYKGFYAQFYQQLDNLWDVHLTAGIRHDEGEYHDDKFEHTSPRIALVKSFTPSFSIKASYGSALRSPGLKEYLLNAESNDVIAKNALHPDRVLAQIPSSLKAETFDSFELSANFNTDTLTSFFSIYHNTTEDALDGNPIRYLDQQGTRQSVNSFANSDGRIESCGIDLHTTWFASSDWQLHGAYSEVIEFKGVDERTLDTPKRKVYLRLQHNFEKGSAFIGHQYRYYDGYQQTDYNLTQLGFNYPINQYLQAQLVVNNLFDNTEYLPFNGINTVPVSQRQVRFAVAMVY
ncbi:TonB-dependent receptor [Catenovulum sp. SM1970]|uniref:TonB-dependent receptor plug domain-containing protein n=1 Tax=Marinifaba aquimaris TaxID=2741323 RepID=UPI001573632F|nr:TonB-dependent receptor [Marinifaba aquimaris]NTS78526.1 TonB-dependent receptor [Marinifaba aquimaris]